MIDAQRDSLRRIREANEFVKLVKYDDAQVPVYLWNERINGWLSKEESEDARDKVLHGFRTME